MSSAVIQLLVLAGIAVFLILRLRAVLGTREGFEKPRVQDTGAAPIDGRARRVEAEMTGPDTDITDHAPEGIPVADALLRMKQVEPDFNVGEFLHGARGAYEMILMAFENGTLDEILPLLSRDVYESFAEVVELRESKGLRVEATFIGMREVKLIAASFDDDTGEAEVTVRFVSELSSVVRDQGGALVEGDPNEIKRQKDIWTFGRRMGVDDPNWQLVATGE